jgi:hypothetical protein
MIGTERLFAYGQRPQRLRPEDKPLADLAIKTLGRAQDKRSSRQEARTVPSGCGRFTSSLGVSSSTPHLASAQGSINWRRALPANLPSRKPQCLGCCHLGVGVFCEASSYGHAPILLFGRSARRFRRSRSGRGSGRFNRHLLHHTGQR